MVIDRAQSKENVYMLSLVNEDDLSEFASTSQASGVVTANADSKALDVNDKEDETEYLETVEAEDVTTDKKVEYEEEDDGYPKKQMF